MVLNTFFVLLFQVFSYSFFIILRLFLYKHFFQKIKASQIQFWHVLQAKTDKDKPGDTFCDSIYKKLIQYQIKKPPNQNSISTSASFMMNVKHFIYSSLLLLIHSSSSLLWGLSLFVKTSIFFENVVSSGYLLLWISRRRRSKETKRIYLKFIFGLFFLSRLITRVSSLFCRVKSLFVITINIGVFIFFIFQNSYFPKIIKVCINIFIFKF